MVALLIIFASNTKIELFTQKLNGLTEEDFRLAEIIDTLPVAYSDLWKKQHPGVYYSCSR